jgi:hypothetical protein
MKNTIKLVIASQLPLPYHVRKMLKLKLQVRKQLNYPIGLYSSLI